MHTTVPYGPTMTICIKHSAHIWAAAKVQLLNFNLQEQVNRKKECMLKLTPMLSEIPSMGLELLLEISAAGLSALECKSSLLLSITGVIKVLHQRCRYRLNFIQGIFHHLPNGQLPVWDSGREYFELLLLIRLPLTSQILYHCLFH